MNQSSDDFLAKTQADYAISTDETREGALFHYHLPEGRDITVYPLLFGEALLCIGRIDRDHWERGYYYASPEEAIEAAEGWIDTSKPPPGDWLRHRG